MSFGIEKARSLYLATQKIRLADSPVLDIKDRLSMLTVAAALRPVGVLEGEGLQLERIRDVLIDHGLCTAVNLRFGANETAPATTQYPQQWRIFLAGSPESQSRVLWLCTERGQRKKLRETQLSGRQIGLSLGYPACCVDADIQDRITETEEMFKDVIAKAGDTEEAFKIGLREWKEPEVPPPHIFRVPATDNRFPFVIHVACQPCLDSDDSPSAILNEQYSRLAQEIDPDFHRAILEAMCESSTY